MKTEFILSLQVSWEKFREEQLNRSSPDEEAGGSSANKDERRLDV